MDYSDSDPDLEFEDGYVCLTGSDNSDEISIDCYEDVNQEGTMLYDFEAEKTNEMSVKKGDTLDIQSRCNGWVYARHMSRIQEGFVPESYVCMRQSVCAPALQIISPRQRRDNWRKRFYMNINRDVAELMLKRPFCENGAFVIRPSSEAPCNVLSLKSLEDDNSEVLHYKIKENEYGGYYINRNKPFRRMLDLVKHYQGQSIDDTCCKLGKSLMTLTRGTDQDDKGWIAIGNGAYTGTSTKNVSIKVCNNTGKIGQSEFNKMATKMKNLQHPRLVPINGVFNAGETTVIVTEQMQNGSLLERLKTTPIDSVQLHERLNMACQIAEGMNYLEKHNIVHQQLCAASVFVDEHKDLKVGNFGCYPRSKDMRMLDLQDNWRWAAPECLEMHKISNKTDVWAFGVLMFEIFTHGVVPYSEIACLEELRTYLANGKTLDKPVTCPGYVYSLMLRCWMDKPEQRPSFAEILKILSSMTTRAAVKQATVIPKHTDATQLTEMVEVSKKLLAKGKRYLENVFPAIDSRSGCDPVLIAIYYRKPKELQQKLSNGVQNKYQGFPVNYMSNIPSSEGCSANSYIQKNNLKISLDDMQDMRNIINQHADDLFSRHFNMTIMTGSPVKITGFGAETVEMKPIPSIVIYCLKKHIIPLGEDLFPTKLGRFCVDIREGSSYVQGDEDPESRSAQGIHLHPGSDVTNMNSNSSGSLGGFVKIGNKTGFLTSGHTFWARRLVQLLGHLVWSVGNWLELSLVMRTSRLLDMSKFNHGEWMLLLSKSI